MLTVSIIFFALFILNSILHIFLYEKNYQEKYIILTKCFIIPLLLLAVLFYTRFDFASYWILYLGLVFMFGGDYFLTLNTRRGFYLGALSFLVGHISYFLFIIFQIEEMKVNPLFYFLLAFLALCFIVFTSIILRKKLNRKQSILGAVYFAQLLCETAVWVLITIESGNALSIFGLVGSIVFIISDVFLVSVRFFGFKIKHYPLKVMGTYTLAQAFIMLSCVLL